MADSDASTLKELSELSLTHQETEVGHKEPIEESGAVNEGKAEAAFEEESGAVNEAKAEAAFEPPKQNPKKQVKRSRKQDGRRTKFDNEGFRRGTHQDVCDCLIPNCPGCWMPCKKCSSTKCGPECRRNRRYEFENVHIQGTSITIKNPYKK